MAERGRETKHRRCLGCVMKGTWREVCEATARSVLLHYQVLFRHQET